MDHIRHLGTLSAFYIYAAEPFLSYVLDEIDSDVAVINDLPLEMLVNPSIAYPSSKVFSRPQQIITISRSNPTHIEDRTPLLENMIKKSSIVRVDEGDGTRMDFFDQVRDRFSKVSSRI
ncbi:hypothetical protein BT96DRAFT_922537, partial [Gymnopus androsaceus JB14]